MKKTGRPTNKEKFIQSILHLIEHSEDPELKDIYICLLKEKIDEHTKNYRLLLYDEITSTLSGLYDIIQKLHIEDDDHSFILSELKAVLDQKYWTMYRQALTKENIF